MRCLACGADMNLIDVVQDETIAVPGFEHHTFTCSGCGDVERRLAFRAVGENSGEPPVVHAAPSISPEPAVGQPPRIPSRGLFRVIDKLLPF